MQSDVSSQWASTTVVGGQIGAKPAAFAGVATRKRRAYGRAVVPRIKQEDKNVIILFLSLCAEYGSKLYTTPM